MENLYKFHMGLTAATPTTTYPSNVLLDKLPVGVYEFKAVETMEGLKVWFEILAPFNIPSKLYGNVQERTTRVLDGYARNTRNLGVLLNGMGGTGKSLLAKNICVEGAKRFELPIIVFTAATVPYVNILFETLNKRQQNAIILFDEFEKIFASSRSPRQNYDEDERVTLTHDTDSQNVLLSILDGIYNDKHLIIMTTNEKEKVNKYLFNRPSRVRYYYDYTSLPESLIEEIINDRLDNKARKGDVFAALNGVSDLTYDNMIEFINECNAYPDLSTDKVIEGFNVSTFNGKLIERYQTTCYLVNKDMSLIDYIVGVFDSVGLPDVDVAISSDYTLSVKDLKDGVAGKTQSRMASTTIQINGDYQYHDMYSAGDRTLRYDGRDILYTTGLQNFSRRIERLLENSLKITDGNQSTSTSSNHGLVENTEPFSNVRNDDNRPTITTSKFNEILKDLRQSLRVVEFRFIAN